MGGLIAALTQRIEAVQGRDLKRAAAMLFAQAYTLDALFHQLATRSAANMEHGYTQAADTYMRLALRAQNQARASRETIGASVT
jgi:hypothetical protein